MTPFSTTDRHWTERWQRFARTSLRAFHAYGTWLARITWARFGILAVLLLVVVNILQSLPPFKWTFTESVETSLPQPVPPPMPKMPKVRIERPAAPVVPDVPDGPAEAGRIGGVNISIDETGVRIQKTPASAPVPASEPAPEAPPAVIEIQTGDKSVRIAVPRGVDAEAMRAAIEEAKQAVSDAVEEARDAAEAAREAQEESNGKTFRTHVMHFGDFLDDLALLWIVASAIIKASYKGRIQAEVKAAQATETAEAESLKRQVVEARMAAMQAQVEPHFLFNTLASIDHLIETDPPRASQMQKNLIALLRASMPTMRDTGDGSARDLGRELAVVRPYVEILKVRMEERLDARIDVPEGLLSAEFPAMMIQTLVENAIRHGLEPKPEGGQLQVKAEIVHGKLQITVADTGVGFGNAPTAGTGVGLANIRERLQLLHGGRASLTVTANQPSGTIVTITVPYRSIGDQPAATGTPAPTAA